MVSVNSQTPDKQEPTTSTGLLHITLQFSGGAETLFNNNRQRKVEIPVSSDTEFTVAQLLEWILRNLLVGCERPELLIVETPSGLDVRPGILILLNDTDWEIVDGLKARLSDNDCVTFISTLHGG